MPVLFENLRKLKQQVFEDIIVEHYRVNQSEVLGDCRVPCLSEQLSSFVSTDLVIIALGTEQVCPLTSELLQQTKEYQLPLIILLADGSKHTLSDLQIPEEQVSTIRSPMSVGTSVEKLLQPFVAPGLVSIDVNDCWCPGVIPQIASLA